MIRRFLTWAAAGLAQIFGPRSTEWTVLTAEDGETRVFLNGKRVYGADAESIKAEMNRSQALVEAKLNDAMRRAGLEPWI
jgi:hypothetical protein